MGMSKCNKDLLVANKKGYRVDINGNVISPFSGKILSLMKGGKDSLQYYYFSIRDYDGNRTTVRVHRLVAYQKFGDDIFNSEIEVRHFNSDSLDNSRDNIKIGTHSENMKDKPKSVRVKAAIKASTHVRILTDNEVELIRLKRLQGFTYQELSDKFGLSGKGHAHYIVNNEYVTVV